MLDAEKRFLRRRIYQATTGGILTEGELWGRWDGKAVCASATATVADVLSLFDSEGMTPNPEQLSFAVHTLPFRSRIIAGFECGFFGWNGHDLLHTTGHVPSDQMAEHYGLVLDHGLLTVRDGLPWRHDTNSRIGAAQRAGIERIWDLSHFGPPPNAVANALATARAALSLQTLWLCPVNEPFLYPALAGMSQDDAVALAITTASVAKDNYPNVRILTTDPITGIGERQFEATDALVAAGFVDVVGVNYYPRTARTTLSKVLVKTWRRYRKPILVSETSWRDGHPLHHRRYPGFSKGRWLQHIVDEAAIAEASGVQVVGVCWYPIVDYPPWGRSRSKRRWSH